MWRSVSRADSLQVIADKLEKMQWTDYIGQPWPAAVFVALPGANDTLSVMPDWVRSH